MQPIALLMIEHRLIERVVRLLYKELGFRRELHASHTEFIAQAVDFFKTYADVSHHGKEENILFRELSKKALSPEHGALISELIEEHKLGRRLVDDLSNASPRSLKKDAPEGKALELAIGALVSLYRKHIEKEDTELFIPCMEYFTKAEQDSMLKEFKEYDSHSEESNFNTAVEKMEKSYALIQEGGR